MTSLLRDRPASSAAMLEAFGDAALLSAALAFEAALARAEAAEGLIPADAARSIAHACAQLTPDIAGLAEEAAHAGTLAIPLVRHLKARVAERDAGAVPFVHYATTSQDVADTALMLQARAGAGLIRAEALALAQALEALVRAHASTPALGRTLLQGALPVTFGLRALQWLLGIDAALRRFERECDAALCVQLGGAAGTLRGLTLAVVERVARELGLGMPAAPWFARRDGIAGLASALAILTGAVAKIARDISLLAQGELAEVFEPRSEGRGGSSAMPHKRNPTGCQVALSAALRAPPIAAAMVSGLPQELERGLGGWQAEGPGLATLFGLTHGALSAMRPVVADLQVDADAMRRNLQAADVGEDVGQARALIERALAQRHGER